MSPVVVGQALAERIGALARLPLQHQMITAALQGQAQQLALRRCGTSRLSDRSLTIRPGTAKIRQVSPILGDSFAKAISPKTNSVGKTASSGSTLVTTKLAYGANYEGFNRTPWSATSSVGLHIGRSSSAKTDIAALLAIAAALMIGIGDVLPTAIRPTSHRQTGRHLRTLPAGCYAIAGGGPRASWPAPGSGYEPAALGPGFGGARAGAVGDLVAVCAGHQREGKSTQNHSLARDLGRAARRCRRGGGPRSAIRKPGTHAGHPQTWAARIRSSWARR